MNTKGKALNEQIKTEREAEGGGLIAGLKTSLTARNLKKRQKKFLKNVLELEEQFQNLESIYKNQGGNLILLSFKLIYGTIS